MKKIARGRKCVHCEEHVESATAWGFEDECYDGFKPGNLNRSSQAGSEGEQMYPLARSVLYLVLTESAWLGTLIGCCEVCDGRHPNGGDVRVMTVHVTRNL